MRLVAAMALLLISGTPVYAASGVSMSLENLFAPLGKDVQRYPTGTSGEPETAFGRETTEWIGVTGFTDLNINWRVLYGLHTTLIGRPLFKFSGSLAYMVNTPYPIPLRPYFFAGIDPVVSTASQIPPFGLTLHTGLGLEYSWNNALFMQFQLRAYMLAPYGESRPFPADAPLTQWLPWTYSLSGGVGYLF